MKKSLAIAAIMSAATLTSYAQSSIDWENVKFGVRAGVNFTGSHRDDTHIRLGYNIGLSADIPVADAVSIKSGLFFTTRGFRYDATAKKEGVTVDTDEEVKTKAYYFQIPVAPSFDFALDKCDFSVFIGPYLALGLTGDMDSDLQKINDGVQEAIKLSDDVFKYDASRFDLGWVVGAQMTFEEHYVLGAQYESSWGQGQQAAVCINVGYKF